MRNYYDSGRPPLVQPPGRWQGGMWERQYAIRQEELDRRRAARSRRKGRRIAAFLLCLALIIGGAGTLYVLRDKWLPYVPVFDGEWSAQWDGGWETGEDDDAFSAITIQRVDPAGDFRLTLAPSTGETMSLGNIYQKNIISIVSITAMGREGGSQGTGVVLSRDGYIVTNTHVIEGASWAEVSFYDGSALEAQLVGYDKNSDIAVLKVDADYLQPAEFGNSDELNVGDIAVAIGNPLGEELRGTMTDGIISAVNRDVAVDGGSMTLIQTSAALNPGNSGGALINSCGQVVGITNMKMMSDYDTIEGLGFAIPSTTVKEVADTIIAEGKVIGDPVLGITVRTDVSGENGLEVYQVETNSDAYDQGVRAGDRIVEANGRAVTDMEDLMDAKEGLAIGDTIDLVVERSGERLTFIVTLMDSNEL